MLATKTVCVNILYSLVFAELISTLLLTSVFYLVRNKNVLRERTVSKIIHGQCKQNKWNESNWIFHGRSVLIYLLLYICYYFTYVY